MTYGFRLKILIFQIYITEKRARVHRDRPCFSWRIINPCSYAAFINTQIYTMSSEEYESLIQTAIKQAHDGIEPSLRAAAEANGLPPSTV
jgi:hypothetical protein